MNYWIVGNDSALAKVKLKQLLTKDFNDDVELLEYDQASGNIDLNDVLTSLNTVSLFSERKCAILYNPGFMDSTNELYIEQLQQFYAHPSYDTSLIIVSTNGVDQRKKIVKLVKSNTQVITCDLLDEDAKISRVRQYLHDKGIKLDNSAQRLLLQRLPSDYASLSNELEKLSLYGDTLSEEVIEQLITRPLESQSFALSDAIGQKNISLSIRIFKDLVVQGNQPIALIALLASNFRFYYQVCSLKEAYYNDEQIANALNIKKGRLFYASKAISSLNSKQCLAILDLLAQLDQDIKSGYVDPNYGFELFILKYSRQKG